MAGRLPVVVALGSVDQALLDKAPGRTHRMKEIHP
jgi:hypothetical protein